MGKEELISIIAVLIFCCVLGAVGLHVYSQNQYELSALHITTTIIVKEKADVPFGYGVIDTKNRGFIVNLLSIDRESIPTTNGHTYNITYYCNKNNERVIVSSKDLNYTEDTVFKCKTNGAECE